MNDKQKDKVKEIKAVLRAFAAVSGFNDGDNTASMFMVIQNLVEELLEYDTE